MSRLARFKQIYILVFIFILAFSLRIAYLTEIKTSPLFYPPSNGLDDSLYHRWGQEIAHGDLLGKEAFNAMPLYPYFLGMVYKIFGPNILIAKLIQFILGVFSCILIYFITKKVFGQTPAVISALLACVYGPFIFYEEILVAEGLTIFLYLLTFLILLWALASPGPKRFFIFGLLAGLATLSKASILLFIPVIFIWLAVKTRPLKKALSYISCIALGLCLAIAPVALRNYQVCHDFIPIVAHGGINFYIGNNSDADGTFRTPKELGGTQQGLLVNSRVLAEKVTARELKPSQVSQFWFSQGLNFIQTEPFKFIRLLGKKLLLLINFYEIPDVRDYQFAKQRFPILNIFFNFNLMLIFAVLGLILSWRANSLVWLLRIFILVYVFSALLFFINSRYRLPVVAFMIVFSGPGLYQYVYILKARRYKKALICLLPLSVIFYLGNIQLVPKDFSGSYNLIGLYQFQKGNYPEAIIQFKKATEVNPQMDVAFYNMGKSFWEIGQIQSALENFNQAIKINPYFYDAYNDKGNIYLSMNNLDQADAQFLQAITINPDYAQAHANLGLVYKKKGQWESALEEYRTALSLEPALASEIYNNIGLVYYDQGEFEQAMAYFQKSIAIKPGLAYAYYNLGLAYAKKGLLTQAKRQWQKALEIKPDFTDAQERLEGLRNLRH